MKEFLLVFRAENKVYPQLPPEEAQARTKKWMDWIGNIAAQNRLVEKGNRLVPNGGKVVRGNNVVTDGPYTEIKEAILGYSLVKAAFLRRSCGAGKRLSGITGGECRGAGDQSAVIPVQNQKPSRYCKAFDFHYVNDNI